MLRVIEERSIAFRTAVSTAPDLNAKVPTCPEWTVQDLVRHLGKVHRFWAEVVEAGQAGPAEGPPSIAAAEESARTAPGEREALVAWSAESTRLLLDALREAGPDRACWTWWGTSPSPQTAGAVARHQVQEATVHTYDAQITTGTPETLPDDAALDGVEEFLATSVATTDAWPYETAVLDFLAVEGRSWRLWLSAEGVRLARLEDDGDGKDDGESEGEGDSASEGKVVSTAYASIRGTAAELVLVLYSRNPFDSLEVGGDLNLFHQLRDWDPEA